MHRHGGKLDQKGVPRVTLVRTQGGEVAHGIVTMATNRPGRL
jgi:hypothetical protein